MAKKILISFKENTKENKLYDEVKKHSDQSAFVKEALDFFLLNRDNNLMVTHQISNDIQIAAISEDENNEIMDILS